MISARKVDPVVWDRIVEVLLDPDNLRKGYEESLEQQQATTKRQRRRLETVERARHKLEQKGANLMAAYLDPDLQITKSEYLQQRAAIDDEVGTLEDEIESLLELLASVEVPPEYETIKAFADEVRDQLEGEDDLTPQDKRKILELLHVQVFIPDDGELWLEGWFESPSEWQSTMSRLWSVRPDRARRSWRAHCRGFCLRCRPMKLWTFHASILSPTCCHPIPRWFGRDLFALHTTPSLTRVWSEADIGLGRVRSRLLIGGSCFWTSCRNSACGSWKCCVNPWRTGRSPSAARAAHTLSPPISCSSGR